MNITLYASFPDAHQAEKALAALLDRGAEQKDLSALFPPDYLRADQDKTVVDKATEGITTTTSADAASGAGKGAGMGLGLGAVAALASLVIPGFGLVTGGGALATALAGLAGATVGGAIAGGVAGYLQDQGVPHRIATDSEEALKNGRAVIAVTCPSGKLGEFEVREIINKYNADTYGRADGVAAMNNLP
mgnify:CR=1 FL=1